MRDAEYEITEDGVMVKIVGTCDGCGRQSYDDEERYWFMMTHRHGSGYYCEACGAKAAADKGWSNDWVGDPWDGEKPYAEGGFMTRMLEER